MKFLWDWDEDFLRSLEQAGLLSPEDGIKFRQSPWAQDAEKFNAQIRKNAALRKQVFTLKRPLAIDRGVGGAPYDSYPWDLPALKEIDAALGEDFLGIQIHEWCGAVNRDFQTLARHDRTAIGEGPKARPPRLSFGMHRDYGDSLPVLPSSPELAREMLDAFRRKQGDFHHYAYLVEGHDCSYHLGFSLGARAAFTEVGRQIPLASIHLAALRGAARYHERPWGCYYEPWDEPWRERRGTHYSRQSLWQLPSDDIPYDPELGHGGHFGSSRALQRRLLYAALLSGADYYAEEYGYENTFESPDTPRLTPYGEVLAEVVEQNRKGGWGTPWHPVVIIVEDDLWPLLSQGALSAKHLLSRRCTLSPEHPLRLLLQACFLPADPMMDGESAVLPSGRFPQLFEIIPLSCATGRVPYDLALYVGNATPQAPEGLQNLYPRLVTVLPETMEVALSSVEALYSANCPLRIRGDVFTMVNREKDQWTVGLFNPYGISRCRRQGDLLDTAFTKSVRITGRWKAYNERTPPCALHNHSPNEVEVAAPPEASASLPFPSAMSAYFLFRLPLAFQFPRHFSLRSASEDTALAHALGKPKDPLGLYQGTEPTRH